MRVPCASSASALRYRVNILGRTLRHLLAFFVLFLLALLIALTLWSDPLRLLPERTHQHQWLESCPPDAARFACNSSRSDTTVYHLYGAIDFQNDNVSVKGDPDGGGWFSPAPPVRSSYTLPINPAQANEIAHLVNLMPEQNVTLLENYDFDRNIYFSYWKDHQLRVGAYPKTNLPEQVSSLLKDFKLNLENALN